MAERDGDRRPSSGSRGLVGRRRCSSVGDDRQQVAGWPVVWRGYAKGSRTAAPARTEPARRAVAAAMTQTSERGPEARLMMAQRGEPTTAAARSRGAGPQLAGADRQLGCNKGIGSSWTAAVGSGDCSATPAAAVARQLCRQWRGDGGGVASTSARAGRQGSRPKHECLMVQRRVTLVYYSSQHRRSLAVARDRVRDPVECTDKDSDLVMHRDKDMDMFHLDRDFNVSVWAYGQPGTAELETDSCYCLRDVALAYIDGRRQMACSLLGGLGGAQLVVEEPSLSRRSPALQSKMGVWPWASMALGRYGSWAVWPGRAKGSWTAASGEIEPAKASDDRDIDETNDEHGPASSDGDDGMARRATQQEGGGDDDDGGAREPTTAEFQKERGAGPRCGATLAAQQQAGRIGRMMDGHGGLAWRS
ncbi:hypothetical protein Scep_009484 [Stephania cephalantha]|uniref:Uncharacterized protein n=1 Tax=Stephania cephalantha TaxID=152367 RepID=A0AAP0JUQ2_9MAGN